jgi:RecQ-mediated genome instability protein 1
MANQRQPPAPAPSSTTTTTTTPNPDLATHLSTHLTTKALPPNTTWLTTFLASTKPTTLLPALQKTALFRLLASDLTTTIQSSPSTTFSSATISDPSIKSQRLPGPIAVQVLDVEDIGRSRWSQVEALEAQERGETTKGREVVRVLLTEDGEGGAAGSTAAAGGSGESNSAGPHKLLLQDAKGTKVYGLEVRGIQGVNVGMSIGAKLILRDFEVARGVVLLEPRCVEVLGGKVDAWDRKWREERKKVLKEKAGMGN